METKDTWFGKRLSQALPEGTYGIFARFYPERSNQLRCRFTLPEGHEMNAAIDVRIRNAFGAHETSFHAHMQEGRQVVVATVQRCADPLPRDT